MSSPVETISRRKFLADAGTLAAGAGTLAAGFLVGAGTTFPIVDEITGHKISKTIEETAGGASDYATSAALTEKQQLVPVGVSHIEGEEVIEENEIFTNSALTVELDNGEKVTLKKLTVGPKANAYNINLKKKRPELLAYAYNGDIVVGPGGTKLGKYHRYGLKPNGISDVSLEYPARSSRGKEYGPSDIVDRFPGLGEDLNNASGGYYIENGKFVITDKKGLEVAKAFNIQFAQLVYYIDDANKDLVLEQTWSNKFGQDVAIGDTSYYWSMYAQVPNGRGGVDTFILTSETMVPISQMVETVRLLSPTGEFKIALADGGNGSSVITKSSNGVSANGVNKFDTHLTPMTLVFTK